MSGKRIAKTVVGLDLLEPRLTAQSCVVLAAVYKSQIEELGDIPSITTFDLPALGRAMRDLVMYEVIEDQPLFRLVGEEFKKRFREAVVGENYFDYVHPSRREQALMSIRNCLDYPCAMAVRNFQVLQSGRQIFTEVLGVPMRGTEQDECPNRLLFADVIVHTSDYMELENTTVVTSSPIERCYIDLGYGAPTDHIDKIDPDNEKLLEEVLRLPYTAPFMEES